jgi:hypothetical protein
MSQSLSSLKGREEARVGFIVASGRPFPELG